MASHSLVIVLVFSTIAYTNAADTPKAPANNDKDFKKIHKNFGLEGYLDNLAPEERRKFNEIDEYLKDVGVVHTLEDLSPENLEKLRYALEGNEIWDRYVGSDRPDSIAASAHRDRVYRKNRRKYEKALNSDFYLANVCIAINGYLCGANIASGHPFLAGISAASSMSIVKVFWAYKVQNRSKLNEGFTILTKKPSLKQLHDQEEKSVYIHQPVNFAQVVDIWPLILNFGVTTLFGCVAHAAKKKAEK